ncbi:MAG TPA: 2-succinyl-5-enolpyruvyl-6-hydroxy-3-cyclohexene-1-carboxylic-acid synthase [Acidimicrobiales bacterium]|nr:2-succinyl-5-enolpyruvyl-6-hydroxy-3-cyclohexene-1-carboxylic-acid synthase [Acidimicrobiales bacterium]
MTASPQATFVATLVDEWARAGVAHAVVAPGSRSTPLVLALAADGRIRLHVHHDERSAAFLALGIGLATGVPAVVLTTSGTAAVELHPAVVEADLARVPLLVCTADRPPELHHVGAPQTVDQTHLYGRSVRWFAEPGVAEPTASATWRSLAARAVAEALGPPAGPVHLNLAFRDPLAALPGPLPPTRADGGPWHRTVPRPATPAPDAVDEVRSLLAGARRGVIVAGGGSGDAEAVHGLASALGWPVLADPRAPARCPAPATVASFDALLRHEATAERLRPDAVLRLGQAPASKVLGQWLAASGAVQVAVEADGTWLDPDRTAAAMVAGDPSGWCRALSDALGGAPTDEGWAPAWAAAEGTASSAMASAIAAVSTPTEPAVARTLAAALPDGATLVVSSSMPVRDLEWYAAPRAGLRVLANRGANGIDGVLSTAVGAAVATGERTAVLIGDIALLHDTNGLLGLAGRGADLTVVVVDNRGGGIFSFLPQSTTVPPEVFERLFGTPHDVDLVALAEVHGLPGTEVSDLDELASAVASPVEGARIVVVRTDRSSNVAVHDRVHAAVAAALDERGGGDPAQPDGISGAQDGPGPA